MILTTATPGKRGKKYAYFPFPKFLKKEGKQLALYFLSKIIERSLCYNDPKQGRETASTLLLPSVIFQEKEVEKVIQNKYIISLPSGQACIPRIVALRHTVSRRRSYERRMHPEGKRAGGAK